MIGVVLVGLVRRVLLARRPINRYVGLERPLDALEQLVGERNLSIL
jgi:hypothetical protein